MAQGQNFQNESGDYPDVNKMTKYDIKNRVQWCRDLSAIRLDLASDVRHGDTETIDGLQNHIALADKMFGRYIAFLTSAVRHFTGDFTGEYALSLAEDALAFVKGERNRYIAKFNSILNGKGIPQ